MMRLSLEIYIGFQMHSEYKKKILYPQSIHKHDLNDFIDSKTQQNV